MSVNQIDAADVSGSLLDGLSHMRRAAGAAPHDGSAAANDESADGGWRGVEVPAAPMPSRVGNAVKLDGGKES